jgi:capping protein beta
MDIVSSMLDLMRRLPPTKTEDNVEALMQISPDYADDLSGNVDQPLKLRVDRATGKEYLICVYNQDGESYRRVRFSSLFPVAAAVRWRIWGMGWRRV